MKFCCHCRKHVAHRPRGLCWSCFNSQAIRSLYPTDPKFGPSVTAVVGSYRLPDFPTIALPGSPEKVAILEQRAVAGIALFHPQDAMLDESGETTREVLRCSA